MELTADQKLLLQNLKELLMYGYEEVAKVSLPRKRVRMRTRLLFQMMGATQSYAESVLKMMSPTPDHPAIYDKSGLVLIRSLNENLINIEYIFACDTQRNAYLFAIDWLQSTLKFANKYKALMTKYPHWDLTFGDKKQASDWNGYIQNLKKDIEKGKKHFKLDIDDKLPPIEQRCIQHDEYLRDKNKLNELNSLEKRYITYYPYFSQATHLTAPGLNMFINYKPDGTVDMDVDSSANEIETLVPVTYALYFTILTFFLKKFHAYNKDIAKKLKELSKNKTV